MRWKQKVGGELVQECLIVVSLRHGLVESEVGWIFGAVGESWFGELIQVVDWEYIALVVG